MGRSGGHGRGRGHLHGHRGPLRVCCRLVAGLLVLAGCTSGGTPGGGPDGSARPSAPSPSAAAGAGTTGAGSPAPLVPELDGQRQPRNRAEARALLDRIAIDQDVFGPDVQRSTPFESDPGSWPVLGRDCVWRTEGLPPDVLATSTRRFHIPAADGRGRVRIHATVTVHRTREESGWETARAMEEVLRCPNQVVRAGEELKGLWGASLYQGEQLNGWSEDAFSESGEWVGEGSGGPRPYRWSQGQFGPVTVAVAGKGAAGFTEEALVALVVQGTGRMMYRAGQALGKVPR
ncbi:hypothetical protein HYE82_32670 [Streptomyces sp. BR123]|uniref:hypothetical protein n=1 Tax=Streptomyces sp. BR123 TaxID=2749828 RepID=UPI0015C49E32|nr:hypothetical protein [Streptomyces sp. BR123]NXY99054.1 hypothetical protein [Streptomyces sp. BR123]